MLAVLLLAISMVMSPPAQADGWPNYWDPRERAVLPDLTGRDRIRFLTTADFPPFNFVDQRNRIAGFHIDLARAVCAELNMTARCQLQVLPWDELAAAMDSRQGEAIIAGLALDSDRRRDYLFTRPFIKLPARFAVRTAAPPAGESAVVLAGRPVGVLRGTAHEALLRAYFPDIRPVAHEDGDALFDGLRNGAVEAVFGDGVQLSFWLGSNEAAGCCGFFDGPYFAPAFLGEGLSIAVRRDSPDLVLAFDHALQALSGNGTMRELYLRYFPNGLY